MQRVGGQPGADDATMYLRGAATINGTNPLILIDGVPRDNIRTLDINEVESISVLKDASATAVFGVRGANGVLIITTKRGTEGKPELSVNVTQSFSKLTREPEMPGSVEYMNLRWQTTGWNPPFLPISSPSLKIRWRDWIRMIPIMHPRLHSENGCTRTTTGIKCLFVVGLRRPT